MRNTRFLFYGEQSYWPALFNTSFYLLDSLSQETGNLKLFCIQNS